MLDLEDDLTENDLNDEAYWKKFHKEMNALKKKMFEKYTSTPWGHVDELKKPENHDFVRRLYAKGKVDIALLKQLGIKTEE